MLIHTHNRTLADNVHCVNLCEIITLERRLICGSWPVEETCTLME